MSRNTAPQRSRCPSSLVGVVLALFVTSLYLPVTTSDPSMLGIHAFLWSFVRLPPGTAANLQFGLSLLYLRRGVWRLAIGNGIGALLFGLFCGVAAGSTTTLSSGYGLWMTSIGAVPIIAYLGILPRAGLPGR